MKSISKLIAVLFVFGIGYSSDKVNKAKIVEVTYIANEGFLITIGDKKILIDGLFGDKDYGFCDIPNEATINSLIKNEGYYKNIDLIATTHAHVDHFYPPFVIEHLINNTKGKFISCKQTIDVLKKQENYENVKNNLIEITPDYSACSDTNINGIGVRVYRLAHGPYYTSDSVSGEKVNRHQNVQNVGFLFNIDGIKVFHSGDSDENGIAEYEHFRLDKEDIDIAFLGRGFILKPECKGYEIAKNYIKAKNIVLMHIHHDEYYEFNEAAGQLKNELGHIKIFKNKMESETYLFE